MANYSAIKATVNAYIKANGKKEITGHILNSVLNATIDSLGRYFQFAGGAMPTDDPGTPDQNVSYLATEPGLYTHFGNIRIANEEVALLFWNGEWVKESIALGIQEVNASVDNQVGTPSVDVSYSGGQLVLTFHNLKGEQGIQGIQGIQGEQGLQGVQGVKGDTGAAAGFGTIGADIAGGVGTPGVSVESSGDNTAKNLMFHFTNLKGETGVTSVVATIDDTSGTPSCQVSLVNGVLTLAFSGLKGLKGDTGVSADYPITIYNGLDSDATDQALAAAQGKVLDGKISQLEAEVDGLDVTITEADVTSVSGRWANNNGVIGTTSSGALHRADAIDLNGILSFNLSTYMSWAATDAAYLCDDSGNILDIIPRLPSPGDPTVITGKAVPSGVTKLYINFASSFIFEGMSPGIEEKFDSKLQEFEGEVESQIDAKVESATAEAIDNYQEQYGAVEIVENSTPMPLTENDFVLGNLNVDGEEINANNVIRSGYIQIVPGASYTFSTSNSYRCRIYCFDKNKNYIFQSSTPWQTETYQGIFPLNADYIRILVASPAGTTTAPVWANIGLSFTVSEVYQYGRAAAESQLETALEQYFNIELPIFSSSPQLPADGETGSDFNAETMTSMEIQSAIESQIDKLSVPNVGVNPYTPKYGTIYETIGKDASGLYDIKAYVFTRRNRFAWRASAALYAWKSGSTTYYTDHRSPLVGDTVYSNNTRTDSGYTVTAYNSAGPSITVNGNTYTREDAAKVDATDIFTQFAPSATTTRIAAYNKSGASVGTATVSSPTQIVLGGKTYARLSSGDFHTENKATIVLWGNEHGPQSDPNEPSIIIYRLIKDLCECGGNDFIKFLRKYCKFVFIPAANPYGINKFVSDAREGRYNANNVNINRNYDTVGWGEQTDSNKGSYAGDQPETQFIMNTVLDVAADIAIDVHCLGYNSTPLNEGRTHYEGYVSALNGKVAEIMVGYCGYSYSSYGDADPSTKATGADWLYSLGIAGGLIEMNAGPYAVSYDGKQHKAEIMFTDYTLLLNVIRMWYYNFDPTLDLSRMSIK